MSQRSRIIVALDGMDGEHALEVARTLASLVAYFKVGLEMIHRHEADVVRRLVDSGARVFLDAKFHDIPNTVSGAVRAAVRSGAGIINVHCSGGADMMKAAVSAASEEAATLGIPAPQLVGVTVLTSLTDDILAGELGIQETLESHVLRLAELAIMSGLHGVIASPHEARALRARFGPSILIITPGVRPEWAPANDQRRVATPAEALRDGADLVVLGRPVTTPPASIGTSLQALSLITAEIEAAN